MVISELEDETVGSIDETTEDGLNNRVVNVAVVVGNLIDVVFATSWLPHNTLIFPSNPPESIYAWKKTYHNADLYTKVFIYNYKEW